jgi:hypothetical protein
MKIGINALVCICWMSVAPAVAQVGTTPQSSRCPAAEQLDELSKQAENGIVLTSEAIAESASAK